MLDGVMLYTICTVLALIVSVSMMWWSFYMNDHKFSTLPRIVPFITVVGLAFVLPSWLGVNQSYDSLNAWHKLLGFFAGMVSLVAGFSTFIIMFNPEASDDYDSMLGF